MKILLIGATSAIAKAFARSYAEKSAHFYLLARNQNQLKELANDLKIRGASSTSYSAIDLAHTKTHSAAMRNAGEFLVNVDVALICHGSLPNQENCERDYNMAEQEITVNGLSTISLCTEIVKIFKNQNSGTLAVITSVAGDRGRQPNFIYGAAKSLVSTYLQGLRGKLLPYNIHVVDIKPGLVDSPMTAEFQKGPLWSTPELVADKIIDSIEKKKHTAYVPGYWRLIMVIVCLIPEFIFKRLKI
tara:strand:+ start:4038 stop:4772 length:735 start_codon:yes stop_codon:yes gene_type:complete